MSSPLAELFDDRELVAKIQRKLPYLFQLAELESSRAGKVGMEVGVMRERIVVALLVYKFGEANVQTEIPITEAEVDARLFGHPISIKTISNARLSGVKLIWTVDAAKAKQFRESYYPSCDILLVQIVWNSEGGFYFIPVEAQRELFHKLGKCGYIKLPTRGTNPRGVEIRREALSALVEHPGSRRIQIKWMRSQVDFNPYARWVDLWRED